MLQLKPIGGKKHNNISTMLGLLLFFPQNKISNINRFLFTRLNQLYYSEGNYHSQPAYLLTSLFGQFHVRLNTNRGEDNIVLTSQTTENKNVVSHEQEVILVTCQAGYEIKKIWRVHLFMSSH